MSEPSGGHAFKRPAYGIARLFQDVNAMAPRRSTRTDGILGDQRHAAEHSGHNPNAQGIVCAGDITHDPAHGCDCGEVSEAIRESRDSRVLYVIFNGRIFDGPEGTQPFVWRTYRPSPGGSMHTDHVHVSLRQDARYYDNDAPWEVTAMPSADEIADAVVAKLLAAPVGPVDNDTNVKPPAKFRFGELLLAIKHQANANRSLLDQLVRRK